MRDRPGLISLFVLLAALLALAPAPTLLAHHGGPIVFVDAKNPPSADKVCDFHFHSIKAALTNCPQELPDNATILVDPGIYNEGQLTISVKGLRLQSSGGAERTKILGSIDIQAKGVLLQGFDINANGFDDAVVVENIQVHLVGNKLHDAKHEGILVEGSSDDVLISGNEPFNNGRIGIRVLGNSRNAQIEKNKVRSNGTSGISIEENSDGFLITDNTISLNQGEGISISGSDNGQIAKNQLTGNGLEGIELQVANGNTIVDNTVSSSSLYGISLVASDNNEVRGNQVSSNGAGGIALREGDQAAQRNTVESNQILGNIKAGASGVLLEGDVTGSIVLNNTLSNNSFGIRFTQSTAKHSPSNNTLVSNEISDSDQDGISVEASAGQNVFRSNKINSNNGVGLYISAGQGNDEVAGNSLESNGDQGILIEGSPRNTVHDNTLTANGGQGIALMSGADATSVIKNTITSGEQEGVFLSGVNDVVVLGNTIQNNQQDAIFGQKVGTLRLEDNTLSGNLERGIALSTCSVRVDIDTNTVSGNAEGGIALNDCNVVDLQNNDITDNVIFGLSTSGQVDQIQAQRNWWGDPRGPAGVFEGAGNAVLGLTTEQVLPWLTAGHNQLIESSVTGFMLRDFGLGKVELDAMDRADLRVELFNLSKEDRGAAVLGKYQQGQPRVLSECQSRQPPDLVACNAAPPNLLAGLTGVVKTVSVLTSGFAAGDALIEVGYDDAELADGVKKANLALFYYNPDKGSWDRLTGQSQTKINLVNGQISVKQLRAGAIIALATGKAAP
mgnify:CR=1 FL=1